MLSDFIVGFLPTPLEVMKYITLMKAKKLDCNYSAVLHHQMAGSQSDAFDMTLLCQVFMRIMVMYVRTGRGKKGSKSFRTRFLRLKVP